jgi:hypothetical protein
MDRWFYIYEYENVWERMDGWRDGPSWVGPHLAATRWRWLLAVAGEEEATDEERERGDDDEGCEHRVSFRGSRWAAKRSPPGAI